MKGEAYIILQVTIPITYGQLYVQANLFKEKTVQWKLNITEKITIQSLEPN